MLLPWAVPALAASAIWKWLFDARYGFVNWALVNLGFDRFQDYAWFADRCSRLRRDLRHRRLAVVPVRRAGAAGRAADDPEGDAAGGRVDGANAWQRFRLVTLPLLRPIVAVLVVFSTIWDFKIFDQIYVMAAGCPTGGRHRGGRRLPRGLRARRTTARLGASPSCCS